MDMVSRICGISSVEGSEGSSGRKRYVVATASGSGLRADASSHQLAGRLPPLLLAQGIKPPRTQQPKNGETEARARDGRS